MSENQRSRGGASADDEYREFVRKMELFENGPTTTNFAQLIAHGIQLPDPTRSVMPTSAPNCGK